MRGHILHTEPPSAPGVIEPFNVRLDRLACKTINKMREMYITPHNRIKESNYKFSDYIIEDQPIRSRRKSLADKIDKYILKPRKHLNILKTEKSWDQWEPPTPIYTCTGKPEAKDN